MANQESAIRQFKMRWLEAFLTVVETRSFTVAARKLGYDRTNVGRDVNALQDWLGRVLFYEYVRFDLTPDGTDFAVTARQILSTLEHSRAFVRSSKASQR